MKIAMSSFTFNRHGGIERASLDVASRLARLGEQVTLVATDVAPVPEPPLAWHKVEMRRGPAFLNPGRYPRAATRSLRRERFDILHNQGGCALTQQDVITAHSCHREWWSLKLKSGEVGRALLNPRHHVVLEMERANYRPGAFRHVIAVSESVARELEHHYEIPSDKITVIPNGVDSDQFHGAPDEVAATRAAVRRRLGLKSDDLVLLFVGKEFRRKGLAFLIDSLPLLPEHVKLLVVGGDDPKPFQHQAVQAGVADRVHFVGHSNEVQEYFQAADVFALPTLYEAFGLVVAEAASAGLPLVVTSVVGAADLLDGERAGMFIERDGSSVANAIATLDADPDLRARMGEHARRQAGRYSWDAIARQTLAVYQRVLDEKGPR
jgi:UDP-glucose:(heptosyl)LPS alpha-1,3-glucosyltransferase